MIISSNELLAWLQENHHSPEDLHDGDLADRLFLHESYRLEELSLSEVNLNEWEICKITVDDYAERCLKEKPPPAIFHPKEGSVVDGIHRLNALNSIGRKRSLVWVPNDQKSKQILRKTL